jgi:hypothetical protein
LNEKIPIETRIRAGGTYSNDLLGPWEQHRRVLAIDASTVTFLVVHGRKKGEKGNCLHETFLRWTRREVS